MQQLLGRLLATALESSETITRSHETALQLSHKRVSDDVGAIMTTLGAAISATTGLQREIVRICGPQRPPLDRCLTCVG